MFTGLVQGVGTVGDATDRGGGRRLGVSVPDAWRDVAPGESVAVSGVCLTVAAVAPGRFHADVIPETVSRSTLGGLRPGSRVNLERALCLGDRLGGHLVQGHVDAVARVLRVQRRGADWRVRIALSGSIRGLVAEKGSIAIDGVSLTVVSAATDSFEVALIPETVSRTTLGGLRAGDRVNVEADVFARYVQRLLEVRRRG